MVRRQHLLTEPLVGTDTYPHGASVSTCRGRGSLPPRGLLCGSSKMVERGKVSCLRARRRPRWGRPVGGSPFSLENRRCTTRPPVEPQPPRYGFPNPASSQKPGAARNGRSQNGRRGHKAPSLPGRLGRGRAPRPDHGHSSQPRGALWGGRRGGGSRGGWGAGEEPERGAGRGTKGPFVEWSREKRQRITQCPEAMLVTREPFSASLGKQLGAERDRERFNPMGAGRRGLRPLWEVGRE